MEAKKITGGILIAVGAILMIIASLGLLQGGGNFLGQSYGVIGSIVPFVLGIVFFTSGISIYKTLGNKPK